MIKRHLYILLFALLYTLSAGAVPYCDVRKFSIVDGLAANSIADIKQGYDNLMWFGTWNGLSFYDGYSFHTFRDDPDKADILSTNRLLTIQPTFKNNIWCVTYDRQLYVYDTHDCRFKDVGRQINEKFGIDLRVEKIFPIKNGSTWVTDANGKYVLRATSPDLDNQMPELIRVGEQGVYSGKVWFIRADPRGREWILTEKGATIYGSKFSTRIPFKWIRWVGDDTFLATTDGKLAMYDERNRLTMIPMPEGVTRINELKNTGYQLLIATNIGLVIYNPRTFKFDVINVQSPSQPLPEATYLYTDAYGLVWVFTDGMGVTVVNPRTGEKQWLFADQKDPADRTTSDHFITQDENKTLWVVPHGGTFSYYDRKAKKLVPYLLRSNSSGNYRVPSISKYLLSDQGILWITGVHDLTQVVFKYHPYSLIGLDDGEEEVRAISASPDSHIWAGYRNGILQILDSRGEQKLGYLTPGGQVVPQQVPFANCGIYALFFDVKGRAWVGTNGNGIYVVDHGQVSHYAHDPKNPSSLPNDKIFDIVSDRTGRIWIATYGGGIALARETAGGAISFVSKYNGLPWEKADSFSRARRICATTTGPILVGTTDGLVTFSDNFSDPRKIKFYKSHYNPNDTTTVEASDINYIMEHTNGSLYISELGGTLEEIVSKTPLQDGVKVKYFHKIAPNEGIVQSMAEGNHGRIWVVRESSIDAVNMKTGVTEVFGPNDFDLNMSFTEARPYHDPATNNISLGTPMGVLTFNPQTLKKTTYQPKIVFTTLHYNGENASIPILHTPKLVIPANKRNLTISFASLDYQRKYQTKYLYRIDGYTPAGEWINNGSSNVIGFNRISHGNYVLKVRATNSHGIWSKYVAELPIEVRPTFWESVWGRMIMLLLVIAIVGIAIYSYNQRQHQKINHEMSMLKNDFFSDAAHQLRTPLTLIGGPIHEVLEQEHGITRKSREMLQLVEKSSSEMLQMLNKILRYDNETNFYTNSGIKEEDYDRSDLETVDGQIDDRNVDEYLEKAEAEKKKKEEETQQTGGTQLEQPKQLDPNAVTILVVEDNAGLRKYLYNILADTYNVLLAENGKAGLLLARTEMPDMVLTDVTMPVMDGITMIHQMKQDSTLANIPIIVLSAKASVEDQLKGFEEGIDAYLTKPFSSAYLQVRIAAVIEKRHKIQMETIRKLKDAGDQDAIKALKLMPIMQPKSAPVQPQPGSAATSGEAKKKEFDFMSTQVNDRAMERILKQVSENIANPDLKIDDIAEATGMSRSVLYNKIKTAVGMTPIDFVRHIRIMKASEMLQNSDDSLTMISYNVGFSDPKYFSKVFKKETGITPTEYRDRTQKL